MNIRFVHFIPFLRILGPRFQISDLFDFQHSRIFFHSISLMMDLLWMEESVLILDPRGFPFTAGASIWLFLTAIRSCSYVSFKVLRILYLSLLC